VPGLLRKDGERQVCKSPLSWGACQVESDTGDGPSSLLRFGSFQGYLTHFFSITVWFLLLTSQVKAESCPAAPAELS